MSTTTHAQTRAPARSVRVLAVLVILAGLILALCVPLSGCGAMTGGAQQFGAGLGAAISALEGTSGRQAIWATGQYLSYAKPGEVMDIDVTIAVEGHQITQARAVGHVGNREILTVNAAPGSGGELTVSALRVEGAGSAARQVRTVSSR
mgnify:CR=1 FL=1